MIKYPKEEEGKESSNEAPKKFGAFSYFLFLNMTKIY